MPDRRRRDAGFSLIEVLIVVFIVGTLLAISLMVLPAVVTAAKADSGSSQLSSLLRSCREQSVTQRRNMQVVFAVPNRAQCFRREIDVVGGATVETGALTLVDEAVFEQGVAYQRFADVNPADTPNAFSPGVVAVDFSGAGPWWFTPEGTFVDANGDVTNGTIFVGQPQQRETARAVTVFGATALIESWQWNGAAWVN